MFSSKLAPGLEVYAGSGVFLLGNNLYNYFMPDAKTVVYEVTATKKRPKIFDELAGQEFVVSTLKNSLESGKIAHAYLFSGPRGCGKTSAARILARSLNCETAAQAGNPQQARTGGASRYTGNPCGECSNCQSISRGASVDVIEIDGASNTGINDVKKIQEEILFPPQTGRYKVYIIDEVHMLSNSAFNALLKTIEEPPPYIIFIFATTELHKVPATIKSRCQQFNFRLIPIETIQGILKNICADAGIQAEDDALFWIARESTGSLRDAYTLFDQVASFSNGHIREEIIREKLGLMGLENLNALAEACAANDTPKAFALIDEIISSGIAIEQCIIDLAGYYRSLLLLKNGITRESLLGYRANLFSEKVLEQFDKIRLEQALELLLDCYRDVRYSISPRFELETAVSKLAWLSDWVSPTELSAVLKTARAVLTRQRLPGTQAPEFRPDKNSAAQDGGASPLASGGARTNTQSPSKPAAIRDHRSLVTDFKIAMAARLGNNGAAADSSGTGQTIGSVDEDDVPMWSTVENSTHASGSENTENESAEEKVLRIIPGIVVSP